MPLFKIKLSTNVEADAHVYVWSSDSGMAQKMAVDQAKKGKLTWRLGCVDTNGAFSTRYTHEILNGDAQYKEIADRFCSEFGEMIEKKYGLPSVCGATYTTQYNMRTREVELVAKIIGDREIKVSDIPKFDLTLAPNELLGQMMTMFDLEQIRARELLAYVFAPLVDTSATP